MIDWSLAPQYAAALVFGYLCGSIPFGIIITRLAGSETLRSRQAISGTAFAPSGLMTPFSPSDGISGTSR